MRKVVEMHKAWRWLTFPRVLLPSVLLFGGLLGSITLYRYVTPPLFASNSFQQSDRAFLAYWRQNIAANECQIIAVDGRQNMAVIIQMTKEQSRQTIPYPAKSAAPVYSLADSGS